MIRASLLASLLLATPAAGEFVLQLPLGAHQTYSATETALSPLVPIGPWADGTVPRQRTEGSIRRTVWAIGGETSLPQVHRLILSQLESRGYTVLLDCVASDCGGFDFRFAIDVVNAPMMRVSLRDYRFVSARQTVSEAPAFVTFLVSRSPVSVYVQMTEYAPVLSGAPGAIVDQPPPEPDTDMASMVLEGLVFDSGSATLGGDPNGMLEKLSVRMAAEPGLSVMLVGHSDMSGGLEGNIAVSRARAESVLQALINDYGIDPARLSSHGVGFLAPRADNATEVGKQKNRRVEAVFSR